MSYADMQAKISDLNKENEKLNKELSDLHTKYDSFEAKHLTEAAALQDSVKRQEKQIASLKGLLKASEEPLLFLQLNLLLGFCG